MVESSRRLLAEMGVPVYVLRTKRASSEIVVIGQKANARLLDDVVRTLRAAGFAPSVRSEAAPSVPCVSVTASSSAKRALWHEIKRLRRELASRAH